MGLAAGALDNQANFFGGLGGIAGKYFGQERGRGVARQIYGGAGVNPAPDSIRGSVYDMNGGGVNNGDIQWT
jgi:hypothetical protein